MSEIKIKCAVCGTEFKPEKEKRYTGMSRGIFNTLYDCYDCPNCGAQYVGQERLEKIEEVRFYTRGE